MHISAVVVTYNRLACVQRTIQCLRNQQTPLDTIIIINNGSTDGTDTWLAQLQGITIITQDNVGGAGGFARGIAHAMSIGADWIWCMDDDVYPQPQCLTSLLPFTTGPYAILSPRRLQEGAIFSTEFSAYNLSNPFSSMYVGKLSTQHITTPTEIQGAAFEGLFIHRSVVTTIGLPNQSLFIFCDDTDFCLRAVQAGFKLCYIPQAIMDKEKFFSQDTWTSRQLKKKWKRFYQVRNAAYLNHHYGQNWAVRYIRSLISLCGYLMIIFMTLPFAKAYQWRDITMLCRAYRDGCKETLGKL